MSSPLSQTIDQKIIDASFIGSPIDFKEGFFILLLFTSIYLLKKGIGIRD